MPDIPGSENGPPIGTPIYDELRPSAGDQPEGDQPSAGEHVVITPQTAGSAGVAHPFDSAEES